MVSAWRPAAPPAVQTRECSGRAAHRQHSGPRASVCWAPVEWVGLLEGSGRGGKRADGTQKEVLQRHVVCQKVERAMDWEGPVRGLKGEQGERRMEHWEVEGWKRGERGVRGWWRCRGEVWRWDRSKYNLEQLLHSCMNLTKQIFKDFYILKVNFTGQIIC